MNQTEHKVCIVTGGSGAIGAAICKRLAASGATVVVNYRSSPDAAEEVVTAIRNKGSEAVAIQADTTRTGDIDRLFNETLERFGRVDVFVANAALGPGGSVAETTEEQYDRVFAVNARGVFFLLQEAAKRISDGGSIINISSGVTSRPFPGTAIYAASKAASELFVRVLAQELGERRVRVNTLSPGATSPGMLDNQSEEHRQAMEHMSHFGRVGTPEEVADAVAFLASDQARWVTGQNLRADGGAFS
jgi:3-oxoacyl-[acyl-carrier protein] reductase